MTKRMLIDATHAEETRVVVLDGTRLEDFDVETATKRHLKGNIYLAKVVRVEPSLQAAFVEYGGNRHGFLAFAEIHPDYYQIPIADRQRLIEMEAEEARLEEEEADLEMALHQSSLGARQISDAPVSEMPSSEVPVAAEFPVPAVSGPESWALAATPPLLAVADVISTSIIPVAEAWALAATPPLLARVAAVTSAAVTLPADAPPPAAPEPVAGSEAAEDDDDDSDDVEGIDSIPASPPPETMGGDTDGGYERSERRMPSRFLRNYKIQEVIRRRQILLVQVVKEERGTKGAALTTYLSLAGRFSVLMPNSPRGGGISRKITSAADRRRLKDIITELDIPKGMGLIVRTAGAQRPKPEIKRDCEYLLRLWDDIREHTIKSIAPALIYEEASLIKRAIRDVYSRDIDEIQVDGEEGWRAAHDFMRMLMPSHAKKVQLWRNGGQPLFARYQVEAQLDGMLLPIVQLRSGGYLVINQAEALVAIDVNSGRSTRERNVEETALRTNLEAADEVARQLRLRDLAGLIVIDFIDMESKRHNAMVERRMKEALKNDRARIQVGHISHFGLLEMSRQRLRPSLAETSFIPCPHCGGTGHVRSTESAAIHVLRGIEDEGSKRRAAEIVVHMATPIALYILNHKRDRLREIEMRYAMRVVVAADDAQAASQYHIERVRAQIAGEAPTVITPDMSMPLPLPYSEPDEEVEEEEEAVAIEEDETEDEADTEETEAEAAEQGEAAPAEAGETAAETERRRRRRRRRRGRRDDVGGVPTGSVESDDGAVEAVASEAVASAPDLAEGDREIAETAPVETHPEETHVEGVPEHIEPAAETEEEARNRRRGRRGGRRRRRDGDGEMSPLGLPGAEQPELVPVYAGPTPADPFGGQAFDIFDVMEQVELSAAAARPAPVVTRSVTLESAAEIVNTSAPEPVPETVAGVSSPPDEAASGLLTPGAGELFSVTPKADAADVPTETLTSGTIEPHPAPAGEVEPTTAEHVVEQPPASATTQPTASVEIPAHAPATVTNNLHAIVGEETPRPAATPVAAGPAAAAAQGKMVSAEAASVQPEAVAMVEPVQPASEQLGLHEPTAMTQTTESTQATTIDNAAAVPPEAIAPEADVPEPEAGIPEPGIPEAGTPEPVLSKPVAAGAMHEAPPVPANDSAPEPLVKPIIIGAGGEPPVEKKRGWWRR